jgi:hypothetical protein
MLALWYAKFLKSLIQIDHEYVSLGAGDVEMVVGISHRHGYGGSIQWLAAGHLGRVWVTKSAKLVPD